MLLDRDEGRTELWRMGWDLICPLLGEEGGVRTTNWQQASIPVTGLSAASPGTERLTFDLGAGVPTDQTPWFQIDAVTLRR